ncbi:MAG: DUF4398 domain-containing protein [Vicinamibacteria bacterium]|nr:DUF4398 domain-containing protein [Vicinamibacteria bacterium]
MPRLVVSCLLACLVAAAAGCADPPNKELHQAQGAIDAARAAGADSYATEEFTAAGEALARAEAAVGQRDYRLALSQALDSRERAQNAAKIAASQKAAVRSEAERLLAEVTSAAVMASTRLTAETARTRSPAVVALQSAVQHARTAVDDAGKALATEDYLEARRRLKGVRDTLAAAQQALPATPAARPVRRRR